MPELALSSAVKAAGEVPGLDPIQIYISESCNFILLRNLKAHNTGNDPAFLPREAPDNKGS